MEPGPLSMSETIEPQPGFREALRFWTRLGFISFGGPAGQIAILHRELVERKRWITEERFSAGLAFCTFLPGPEAQQLATYIGWSLHGVRGGLAAGILFFLPAAFLLLLLSFIRAEYGTLPFVAATLSACVRWWSRSSVTPCSAWPAEPCLRTTPWQWRFWRSRPSSCFAFRSPGLCFSRLSSECSYLLSDRMFLQRRRPRGRRPEGRPLGRGGCSQWVWPSG